VAADLVERARSSTVVWVQGVDGDPELVRALAELVASEADRAASPPELEVLPGSWDSPGARFLDLVAVMDRLRSPGGCPWDREQTHASLVPYLLEEAYETVEAVETGDSEHLKEELGDLLLQAVFHSRIAAEQPEGQAWTIDDVAGGIVDKLVRRHPHVFAGAQADTASDVEASWEALKAAEKSRTSAVDGVPLAQPALALAAKLLHRAEKFGVPVEVESSIARPEVVDADSVGELLLSVVALARAHGVDPEASLRAAARRLSDRVRNAER
jgi:XTP/dITP diphosphohydrolase